MIRELPEQNKRVETGPVKFGKDWPGYFIRGDNLAYFIMCFDEYKNGNIDPIMKIAFENMIYDMRNALI